VGTLYICGTPIGNLEDVTIRLLKTLRKVNLIACEDTRNTIKLLNRYKIRNKLISYHEHSDKSREDFIINELINGKDVALVSDAGMPVICDPGNELINKAIAAGIKIEVIPGPSALISALVMSGMDVSSFIFAGFLPAKKNQRIALLEFLNKEPRTIIIYESPHRLMAALDDISEVMGKQRKIAVARELTKLHEEVVRGEVSLVKEKFTDQPPRGELCIVISAQEKQPGAKDIEIIVNEVEKLIENGWEKKEAFKLKAKETRISKSIIYNYYLNKTKNK